MIDTDANIIVLTGKSSYVSAIQKAKLHDIIEGKYDGALLTNSSRTRYFYIDATTAKEMLERLPEFKWIGEWTGEDINGNKIKGFHKFGFVPDEA